MPDGPPAPDAELLSGDVPMQVQIYRQLRAEILDGLWIGRDFPGERDTAERFGVSVITARTALERLAREHLVDRGRGRRGRATYTPPETTPAHLTMFPPPEGPSSPLRYKLVSTGIDIAPADACRAFGLPPGSDALAGSPSHQHPTRRARRHPQRPTPRPRRRRHHQRPQQQTDGRPAALRRRRRRGPPTAHPRHHPAAHRRPTTSTQPRHPRAHDRRAPRGQATTAPSNGCAPSATPTDRPPTTPRPRHRTWSSDQPTN